MMAAVRPPAASGLRRQGPGRSSSCVSFEVVRAVVSLGRAAFHHNPEVIRAIVLLREPAFHHNPEVIRAIVLEDRGHGGRARCYQ